MCVSLDRQINLTNSAWKIVHNAYLSNIERRISSFLMVQRQASKYTSMVDMTIHTHLGYGFALEKNSVQMVVSSYRFQLMETKHHTYRCRARQLSCQIRHDGLSFCLSF
jgi:hypothetical protein